MTKIRYEKEDDVLTFWLSNKKIDHAEQAGDLIVHFNEKDTPVFVEILNATKFLSQISRAFPKATKIKVLAH
ncbi:MAG: DUF2283 domain-containing protein [Patescibacteria group bacterium]